MSLFNKCVNSLLLESDVNSLPKPFNNSYYESYINIDSFVTRKDEIPPSEYVSRITKQGALLTRFKPEEIDKIIKAFQTPIPGLGGAALNDIFSPNIFVSNLYKAANVYNKTPGYYNKIGDAYVEYISNQNDAASLATLIATVTTLDKGFISRAIKSVIFKIISTLPGGNSIFGLLLGSFAESENQLTGLVDDFDNIGSYIVGIKNSNNLPGQILNVVIRNAVEDYKTAATTGLIGLATDLTKTSDMVDKAKQAYEKGKEYGKEYGEKAVEYSKEKLNQTLDYLEKEGQQHPFKVPPVRTPGKAYSGTSGSRRGKIGSTTPAP